MRNKDYHIFRNINSLWPILINKMGEAKYSIKNLINFIKLLNFDNSLQLFSFLLQVRKSVCKGLNCLMDLSSSLPCKISIHFMSDQLLKHKRKILLNFKPNLKPNCIFKMNLKYNYFHIDSKYFKSNHRFTIKLCNGRRHFLRDISTISSYNYRFCINSKYYLLLSYIVSINQ
jgi:hypothetical protein